MTLLLHHLGYEADRATKAAAAPRRSANLDWLMRRAEVTDEELRSCHADLRTLLSIRPETKRLDKIERARNHYRSPLLSALLLDLAAESFHDDPQEAEHLSRLAERVSYRALHLPLQALATAYVSNSLRARGKLEAASREIARTRHLAHLQGVDDFFAAQLYSIEASLRADQRRLSEAHRLLAMASDLYQKLDLASGEARCLLQLASFYYYAGEAHEAVAHARRAMRLIEYVEDPRLHLWAHHNLALYLLEAGDAADARQLLTAVAPLYVDADLLPRLRLLWLEGRLALELAEYEAAEDLLGRSVDAFLGQGYVLFAAMACLDLAALHLATGNTTVLHRLATTLPPIFRSEGLAAPASAALVLLHQAVAREAVTESVLRAAKVILQQNHRIV